jgi:hypothetical protein
MLSQKAEVRIVGTGIMIFFTLLSISFLFGFEPQVRPLYEGRVVTSNYQDYMSRSVEQNDDTIPVRILTTIAYPGAVSGAWVHNQFFCRTC